MLPWARATVLLWPVGCVKAQQGGEGAGEGSAGFQTASAVHNQHLPRAGKGGGEGNEVDAAYRGESGQRRGVGNLRIAQRAPAEAGEQAFAGELGQRPEHGQGEADGKPAVAPHPAPQPHGGGGIQREVGGQQGGERQGVEVGQAGDVVQRGVYPVKLAGVGGQAEQVRAAHAHFGAQFEQAHEGGKQQRHQPEAVIRREGERRGGGQHRQQRPVHGGFAPQVFEFGENVGHMMRPLVRVKTKARIVPKFRRAAACEKCYTFAMVL